MTHRALLRIAGCLWPALLAAACSSSGDQKDDWTPPLPADCRGRYVCTLVGVGEPQLTLTGALLSENGSCYYQSSDGSLLLDLSSEGVTITGRSFFLDVNAAGSVEELDCEPELSAGLAKCSGSAASCGGIETCNLQEGCHYSIGASLSTYDDACEGSPTSCEHFDSKASCEHQQGCRWG
jgi:hypothetical protein